MKSIKNILKISIRATLYFIFICTFGPFLIIRHNIKLTKNEAKGLKGPYLFLSNHSNNYDAFFYVYLMKTIIYFVGTDSVFRMPVVGPLLKYFGFIKKRKFVVDPNTIRQIVKTIRDGKIVGIMPEGRRTWNGVTVSFFASTTRLIKLLKVPVIMGNVRGGYCTKPRWGNSLRRGKMEISISVLLTPEQIAKMNLDEIQETLKNGLYNDDIAWARENNITYKGKKMAESLNLYLASCPSCKKFFTMSSQGNHFSCTNCGASLNINNHYDFIDKNKIPFDSVLEWSIWQEEYLKQYLLNEDNSLICEGAIVEYASTLSAYKPFTTGKLILNSLGLRVQNTNGETSSFSLQKILGACVLVGGYLAFQYDLVDYKISFASGDISAFLWMLAIVTLTGMTEEEQGLVK